MSDTCDLFDECESLGVDFGSNRDAKREAANLQQMMEVLRARRFRAEENGESTRLLTMMIKAAADKLQSIWDKVDEDGEI